jgi:hypothetical protein
MAKVKFGWHMPSFPPDTSHGAAFIDQITRTLTLIQGHFASAWADDHVHPWASFASADTDALECMTTLSYLAGAFPRLDFGSLVVCQSYRNPALLAKMGANLQLLTGGTSKTLFVNPSQHRCPPLWSVAAVKNSPCG